MNKSFIQHNEVVTKIANQIKDYLTSHRHKNLRFYHGSTNSTRDQTNNDKYYFIDISNLNDIIGVNKEKKYALVEPNVSMDKLAKATLEHGLLPPVVMEFPGITAGGAVNGATLEASSYKYGQFNDNCEEYEIILGNGEIIKANSKKHQDIFYGISGTYGSLGLLTLIKVKLIPVKAYVQTTFLPSGGYEETINTIKREIDNKENDFIDAILLDSNHGVTITGKFAHKDKEKIETFEKASDEWFWERARKTSKENKPYQEEIPVFDFLFRYNRGAYWMGEYIFPMLHLPDDKVTKFIFNPFMNTRKLYDGLHALNVSQEFFIQDFYCPFDKSLDFLKFSEENLGIFPIWLCPIKAAKNSQKISPSYIKDDILLDIGIWGKTEKYLKNPIGLNKLFENYAKELGARKMLYAHAYYTEDEFWKIYDKEWYDNLRKKYSADKIFPDVWGKTHVEEEKYKTHIIKGSIKMLLETVKGKNLSTVK